MARMSSWREWTTTVGLSLALAGAGQAQLQPQPAAEEEPAESTAEGDSAAGCNCSTEGRYGEEVLVEGQPAFLPSTNTILSRFELTPGETPANVGVVEGAMLEAQGALVLGDALPNVSSLNSQTGAGVFDYFTLRGFDSLSSALILSDGAPEPEATFYPLYNVEKVEVLKGPGGFLYGSNPLAGAINLVRKQPIPSTFGAVELAGGSFSTGEARVDAGVASADGGWLFRVNGLDRQSDGYRNGKDSEVWAVNPALTYRRGEASFQLNLEAARSDFMPDAGLPLVDGRELPAVSRDQGYESPFDRSKQKIGRAQLDFELPLGSALTLRNKTYYRRLDWQTNGTLLLFTAPIPTGEHIVGRALTLLDDDQRYLGDRVELVYKQKGGGLTQQILAGVEVQRYDDDFTLDVAALPVIGLEHPVESATRPLFLIPGQGQRGDARSEVVAPYVIDQLVLSERWQLLGGLRWDSIEFKDRASGTRRSDGKLSPMLGVSFTPQPTTTAYLNAGEAFAPPSPRVVGPAKPEESRQVELGVRQKLAGDRLGATLAVYQIERKNIAIAGADGFTEQTGDQRSRGFELELAGQLTRDLFLALTYAHTDSTLVRFREVIQVPTPTGVLVPVVFDWSGNEAAFAPAALAKLWLSYRLSPAWRLSGGLRYVGEQAIDEDNVFKTDAYALADAELAWDRGAWRVSLVGRNLADQDYETRAFGASSVIPGEPRNLSLRLGYRLR